jgi:alpha-L-rhamnosidase
MQNFLTRKLTGLIGLILAALLSACTSSLSIDDLRCEYLTNPMGIDVPQPRFSWTIRAVERGTYQTAFRVIVDSDLSGTEGKRGNCWDSGWTESDLTTQIAFDGKALVSDRSYYWRAASLINGREVWSKPAVFHTGLLHADDWQAQWIGAGEEIISESPLLRTTFAVEKRIRSAYLYTAAAGSYEVYLNGEKVGEDVLNPSITDYRKTVLYSVYDVSTLLREGDNALGVMLGNSAYNLRRIDGRYGWSEHPPMGNPRFAMQMTVTYEDGTEALVSTGGDWKYAFGAITFNHLFGGEDYDARLEQTGWATAGFDDGGWKPVAVMDSPGGVLRWQAVPIRVTETLTPVAATHPSPGVYLFDLGQNIAGWWRVQVKGVAGQTLRIRGAETLNNALFAKPLEAGDTLSTKEGYHARVWTDYTLKDSERETYEPHFFYTGFRYIEVTVDGQEPEALNVEGRVVRSALERNGEWTSSNPLLNGIHEAGLWSQKANTVGYPTDCPHREKGAYTGDGQAIAEAAMHDFHMAPFYYKWLNDMRDAQEPGGRIPNTAPPVVGGMGGGVAWGSAYLLIPWWMYQYYDDTRILKEHYPGMKRYLQYLNNLARTDANPQEPYIINYFDGYWYSLGEWCAPGQSDCPNHAVVNTFYYYYNAKLLSQIATVLGYRDDALRYLELSDTVRQALNDRFFSPQTMYYGTDSTYQTYQLLALAGDLAPTVRRENVLQTVIDDLRKRDNHLNTGIFGTKYLWPVLSREGYHDLAYAVATQETYPSYGFWLRNHFTTLPEEWNGGGSHNHQMFGSITEYFYKYLAGIRPPEEGITTGGYRHVCLHPCLPDNLRMARASLHTLSGEIVSGWQRQDGGYRYEAVIPANTTATVFLPVDAFRQVQLTDNGKVVWRDNAFAGAANGIRDVKADGGHLCLSLGSGAYSFDISGQQ